MHDTVLFNVSAKYCMEQVYFNYGLLIMSYNYVAQQNVKLHALQEETTLEGGLDMCGVLKLCVHTATVHVFKKC